MREQKEQEKQNELLRVVAEQNHERLIEYEVHCQGRWAKERDMENNRR